MSDGVTEERNEQETHGTRFRVTTLGEGGVGKSTLIFRMLTPRLDYVEEYDYTVEDEWAIELPLDGKTCTMSILDTGGQQEFHSWRSRQISWGQGFLLVYSVTSIYSYQEIMPYWRQVVHLKGKDAPIVLVATKCDMEEERCVSQAEGEDLAHFLDCPFYETSSKDLIHVQEIFMEVARAILKRK